MMAGRGGILRAEIFYPKIAIRSRIHPIAEQTGDFTRIP